MSFATATLMAAGLTTMTAMAADADSVMSLETNANFDVSCMLFAVMAVSMMMVYMLDNKDPDIKKVSWEILNKSVCTLIGVLISTSFSAFLEWVTGAKDPFPSFLVNFVAFWFWYALMHAALLKVGGMLSSDANIPEKVSCADFRNKLHFWAPLVSVIGGCSNMKVWALGQQLVVTHVCEDDLNCNHSERMLSALVIVGLNLGSMKLVHMACDQFRNYVVMLDNKEDEQETIWIKECRNCEDNVDTMALAFLLMQFMRYELFGHLPGPTGLNPAGLVVTSKMMWQLFTLSIICIATYIMANLFLPDKPTTIIPGLPKSGARIKKRTMLVLKNCTGFSWLYLGTWIGAECFGNRVIGACLQAAITTFLCFVLIKLIDCFKDAECTPAKVDKQLELTYQPIALLIGFSWKLAFAGALKEISGDVHVLPAPIEIFLLTVALSLVILPGWRNYILPVLFPKEVPGATDVCSTANSPVRSQGNQDGLQKPLLQPNPMWQL